MKKEDKNYTIKKVFPVFRWLKCNKCEKLFRFESGFEVEYDRNSYFFYRNFYYCQDCMKNKQEAEKYIENGFILYEVD
jgi:hypothetical protein